MFWREKMLGVRNGFAFKMSPALKIANAVPVYLTNRPYFSIMRIINTLIDHRSRPVVITHAHTLATADKEKEAN